MIVYTGSIEDAPELIQFFRRESDKLRTHRRVVISPAHTRVLDINKDGVEFPRLSYGSELLELLLRELGVVFNKQTLHAHPDAIKEFDISARWAWGHDRVVWPLLSGTGRPGIGDTHHHFIFMRKF